MGSHSLRGHSHFNHFYLKETHRVLKVRSLKRSDKSSSSRRRLVIIEYSTSGAFSITKAFSGGERLHQSLIPSRRKAFFTFKQPLVLPFSPFNLTGKKYCINGEMLVKVIDQKHRPHKRIRFIYKIVECLFSPTFCHSTNRIQI